MKLSQIFFKTLRENPKNEISVNARLLIRAGFIHKLSAGIYSFLPLGLRVLRKIENIIREEMNFIGSQEILMPALHPREIWEETDRWNSVDYLYRLKDRQGKDFALGPTHEEIVVDIARRFISSYRDLPLYLYQIQTKFRDELRAKSGLLRTKEFLMKDLYSFHPDKDDLMIFYEKATEAYLKIFKRCGFKKIIISEASGGTIADSYSHEFQAPTPAGEDVVIFCSKCSFAQNKEIINETVKKCPKCGGDLDSAKTIEVGNIFNLGTKYSTSMSLYYVDKNGLKKPVVMGCYGIGPSRLMGAVVESNYDEKGIIWPEEIAPFQIIIVPLDSKDFDLKAKIKKMALDIYSQLIEKNIEVLYDDRSDLSSGEKLVESDLLGIPWRIVVSEKTLIQGKVELKERRGGREKFMEPEKVIAAISNNYKK